MERDGPVEEGLKSASVSPCTVLHSSKSSPSLPQLDLVRRRGCLIEKKLARRCVLGDLFGMVRTYYSASRFSFVLDSSESRWPFLTAFAQLQEIFITMKFGCRRRKE